MKIHKEGYYLIFAFLFLLIAVIVLVEILLPERTWVNYVIYLACGVVFGFLTVFFRSPSRLSHTDHNLILAPADGKVVVIEKVFDNEYFHEERIQVSIFMSPINVHVNWYPISGRILYYRYLPGRYLVAWHPKSSNANERTTVVLENEKKQKVLVKQIAGAVARRIVCYASENQEVTQGAEMGFIKFGSRLDLLLPVETQILVNINQKVTGKKTVIGRFKS
ncbi:MAG: phosphatidylserine decarboxylase family protein [Bacteroidetes bacterium]|nr:phosphatidylserine decarboxylase family protein [Bacteroidota bacterium]